VWGIAPDFYIHSGLPPATRFALPQDSISGYVPGRQAEGPVTAASQAASARDWDLLLGDLERHHATFILDMAPTGLRRWNAFPVARFPQLRAYLAAHYDALATVDRALIYRRRGCAGRPLDDAPYVRGPG
ncbi:MAG: hypothetical protein ABI880_10895, partial [Acidobacteriota bacterium]